MFDYCRLYDIYSVGSAGKKENRLHNMTKLIYLEAGTRGRLISSRASSFHQSQADLHRRQEPYPVRRIFTATLSPPTEPVSLGVLAQSEPFTTGHMTAHGCLKSVRSSPSRQQAERTLSRPSFPAQTRTGFPAAHSSFPRSADQKPKARWSPMTKVPSRVMCRARQ